MTEIQTDAPDVDKDEVERLAQEQAAKLAAEEAAKLMEKHGVRPSMTNAELRRSTAKNEYIIEDTFVRNQPMTISGLSKTMKTTIGIDMAISLASGKDFLGVKKVNSIERVLFFTAEIGESTARENEFRISKSKLVFNELNSDQIFWQTWVPYIPDSEHLAILDYEIKRTKATVVILDPLYQMLDGDTAMSYSLNGQQLRTISQQCLKNGATPIIIDHAKKSSDNAKLFSPLELEDISGAGKAEFFRQWILISRRKRWEPDQPHELWLSIGGSAGHACLLGVSIDEAIDQTTKERGYIVTAESGHETREIMTEQRQRNLEMKKQKQKEIKLKSNCEKIIQSFLGGDPMTKSALRTKSGLNESNVNEAIAVLLRSKKIEQTEKTVNGRVFDAFYMSDTEHQSASVSISQIPLLSGAVG